VCEEFDLKLMTARVYRRREKMEKRFVDPRGAEIPRGGALYVHISQNPAALAPEQRLSCSSVMTHEALS
jgi:hypothetical protein